MSVRATAPTAGALRGLESLPPAGAVQQARRLLSRRHAWVAAILYVVAAALFERSALTHLGSDCACAPITTDPSQYMWAFEWFPYAVTHGLNPFITHYLWASPGGYDLATVASVPAEAILAWPITAVWGPLVAFNIITIAAPALAAWFAYRLCHYVTRSPAASIFGGYLYGFSTYQFGHMLGHLNLDVTFAVPAAVLLTLQRFDRVLGRGRYVGLLALLLIFQMLSSSEILVTLTCLGVVAGSLVLVLFGHEERQRLVRLLPEIGLAYGLMALICSPFLYYALQATPAGGQLGADLLSFFLPTGTTRLGSAQFGAVSANFPGGIAEQGTYLGLPLLMIVAAEAVQRWRRPGTKLLVALLSIGVLWALGAHLHVDGHQTIRLPWVLLWHLPVFRLMLTVRIGLYISLFAAILASQWVAAGSFRVRRWLLALAAVAFLLPNTAATEGASRLPLFHARYSVPAFFRGTLYRRYLRRDEVVLPLPFGVAPYDFFQLWQAQTGMYFRLASGVFGAYLDDLPPSYRLPVVAELNSGATTVPGAAAGLRQLVVANRVGTILLDPQHAQPWERVVASLGLRPLGVGGILVYRVPPTWRTAPRG